MTCEVVRKSRDQLAVAQAPIHSNRRPQSDTPQRLDAYFCNALRPLPFLSARSIWAMSGSGTAKLFGATKPFHSQTLPAPDDMRLKVLYDVFRQLQGLNASVKLRIPIKNLNKDGHRVDVAAKGRVGEYGSLDAIEVNFSPAFRRKIPYISEVPIIGLGFHVFIPKIWLNKKTRRLHALTQAGILYLLWPFAKIGGSDTVAGDQQSRLLDMAKLTPETRHGAGYNLDSTLPRYPWQLVDIALKMVSQRNFQETIKAAGIDTMRVEWDKSEILVEGAFSARKISVGDKVNIDFAPIAKEKHRLKISGSLLKPELVVEGIRSIDLDDGKSALHMDTSKKDPDPLKVRFRFYPDSWTEPDIMLDTYRHERLVFETTPEPGKPRVRLDFKEGIELEALRLRLRKTGPELDIAKIVAKQASFEGLGVEIQTEPGGRTTLENFTFRMLGGKPRVEADIRGQSIGSIRYGTETGSHGHIDFRIETEATGHVIAGPDPRKNNRPLVQVGGQITAEMPRINFLVQSNELAGFMQLVLEGARASGKGRLRVWTDTRDAILEAIGPGQPLTFEGTGGQVRFFQNPSKVASWPELKQRLGLNAENVTSDLRVMPHDLRFSVGRMEVTAAVNPKTAQPTLKITDADLRDISIIGDVYGRLYGRVPTGHYIPIVIPKDAEMKNASIGIKRLQDHTSGDTRIVSISAIKISGEESKATFSQRNRRLCGIDRQHIHATVGLFEFRPESHEFRIENVDPHFHLYLQNPLLGGCIKID